MHWSAINGKEKAGVLRRIVVIVRVSKGKGKGSGFI